VILRRSGVALLQVDAGGCRVRQDEVRVVVQVELEITHRSRVDLLVGRREYARADEDFGHPQRVC
jgi:hypothetical protein